MQQAVAEEIKNAIRRGKVDREKAKSAIRYLGQPMGRFAIKRLKDTWSTWMNDRDDNVLLTAVDSLANEFAKEPESGLNPQISLTRDDLNLICFEYVSS
jgi:hypothetical protein